LLSAATLQQFQNGLGKRVRGQKGTEYSSQVPVEKAVRSSLQIFVRSGNVDAMNIGKISCASSQIKKNQLCFGPKLIGRGGFMKEQNVRLGPREQQIVELLLQGCDNAEIASQLKMARRTVKAHFNRLFLRFGITGGIKRVKLATLLYRRQACQEMNVMAPASPMSESSESSSSWPKA
jgi:hypothetical protein